MKYLLEVGSASLGGARPKASIIDDDKLYIAKFPHQHDTHDVIGLEYKTLQLAQKLGLSVPHFFRERVGRHNVLCLERFDRKGAERIGYISAMTLLGLQDGDQADYADIIRGIRNVSEQPKADLEELFRRIVFSVAVNNTDDHLRNHGFLHGKAGWHLSPIFDVNPNPEKNVARATSIFGATGAERLTWRMKGTTPWGRVTC
jgi:serine/threonine-protein kinase HipA